MGYTLACAISPTFGESMQGDRSGWLVYFVDDHVGLRYGRAVGLPGFHFDRYCFENLSVLSMTIVL